MHNPANHSEWNTNISWSLQNFPELVFFFPWPHCVLVVGLAHLAAASSSLAWLTLLVGQRRGLQDGPARLLVVFVACRSVSSFYLEPVRADFGIPSLRFVRLALIVNSHMINLSA